MNALVDATRALSQAIRDCGVNDASVSGSWRAMINTGNDVESVDRVLAALVAIGGAVISPLRDVGNDTSEWRVASVAIDGFEIHLHGGHRRRA